VDSNHSQMTFWNAAAKLPNGMIDSWNSVAKVIQQNIAPSFAWSGAMLSSFTGSKATPSGPKYGVSEEVGQEIEKLQVKYFFAENTTAANEEAKLCLRKTIWGESGDYAEWVTKFCAREREAQQQMSSRPKVVVKAYFAASDMMIGKGGKEYFDKCWTQDGVSDAVGYESTELPDTDHDSALLDHEKGAVKHIFEKIGSKGS
jgi:hypothetical protein